MNLSILHPHSRSSGASVFGTAATFVLLAFLAPVALLAEPAAPRRPRILHVVGRAEVAVPVTVGRLRIGLQARSKSAGGAQADLRRRISETMGLLKDGGASSMEIRSLRLGALPEGSKIASADGLEFVAAATLECQAPADSVGLLADAVLRRGSATLDGIDFGPTEEMLRETRQAAWKAAAADARAHAGAVLAPLGLKIEEVVSVRLEHEADAWGMKGNLGRSTVRATVEMEVRY